MKSLITVVLGSPLLTGCDYHGQRLATLLPAGRDVRIPAEPLRGQSGQLQEADMAACDERARQAPRLQDDVYVACMITRGYRTFFGVVVFIDGSLTRFPMAPVRQFEVAMREDCPLDPVFADLQTCQEETRRAPKGSRARPEDLFVQIDETFLPCMTTRGYEARRWEPPPRP